MTEEIQNYNNISSEELVRLMAESGSFRFVGKEGVFDKIIAGLPVNLSVPTRVGKDGEIVLYKDTANSDYRIYVYLDGAWKKVGDIDYSTIIDHGALTGLNDNDHTAIYYSKSEVDGLLSPKLDDIVEDTTPQLGGNLDTNDKAITSEGGAIKVYTINKSVAETGAGYTNIFTTTIGTAGSYFVEFDYIVSVVTTDNACSIIAGKIYFSHGSNVSSFSSFTEPIIKLEEVNTSGMASIGLFWDGSVANFNVYTLSMQQNNDLNANVILTGKIKIYSTTTDISYAEA